MFPDIIIEAPNFHLAHEAACYILDKTKGLCTDEQLNEFVLMKTRKALKNTPKQNRNRVKKYRKSWLKHRHCRDMHA